MSTLTPNALSAREANFDGIVGPTHHYAGLSFGNVASHANAGRLAHPREAAKQGLRKMKALADLGFAQGVLAPHERPSTRLLRGLGFAGSDAQVLRRAATDAPALLAAAASASAMWVANAATVSPSADTGDARVHFTVANLASKLHRSIEADVTERLLQAVFADPARFVVHPPLRGTPALFDEGAANHTRLCASYDAPGVELFVYGRSEFTDAGSGAAHSPLRFPARHTREASEAVARLHDLSPDATVFAQQHPDAIDAGVFHNDVIAVGDRNMLFCHQDAFAERAALYAELDAKLARRGGALHVVEVPRDVVTLDEAVSSYLFNSQLLAYPDGRTGSSHLLVAPTECRENSRVWDYLQHLVQSDDSPLGAVHVFDLRESMRNGGGPACLRLRVVLNPAEFAAVNRAVWLDDTLFVALDAWIDRHYRDRLDSADLADAALLDECRHALDELTVLLRLGSIYDFQR